MSAFGIYSVSEVDQAIALLDPTMAVIQAQRGVLTAVDAQGWDGVFSGWGQVKSNWAGLKSASNFLNGWGPEISQSSDTMGKVQNYQDLAGQYSAKIAAGGGTAPIVPKVNPAPPAPPPDPSNPSGGSGAAWSTTVLTVAIIGGVAYGVHAVLSILPGKRR